RGADANAKTALTHEGEPIEYERPVARPRHAGHALVVVPTVAEGREHGELVAAKVRHEVARSNCRDEPLAGLDEQPVAQRVTEGVVDRPEPVEIHDHDAEARRPILQGDRDPQREEVTVWQPAQYVMQRVVASLYRRASALIRRKDRGNEERKEKRAPVDDEEHGQALAREHEGRRRLEQQIVREHGPKGNAVGGGVPALNQGLLES